MHGSNSLGGGDASKCSGWGDVLHPPPPYVTPLTDTLLEQVYSCTIPSRYIANGLLQHFIGGKPIKILSLYTRTVTVEIQ